mmetsp:Transcript_20329/g.37725  ORF Transcript_20329/g.37725 Transcript_20329/m.37725 type:complete len:212 (-) Transcript_20329:249-884(-)
MQHTQNAEAKQGSLSFNKQAVLKGTWALCLFFTVVFILVAVIAADDNQKSSGGYKAIGFTSIWTSFMMIAIMSLAAQVVFDEWHSPFVVGSLIGSCVMMAQMQFVMMIVYFVFGDHAKNNGHDVSDSDRALGAFSLFTMLVYLLLAAVLGWFSGEITGSAVGEPLDEEQRMMDNSNGSSQKSQDNPPATFTVDDYGGADVVDVDLEETETF